MKNSQIEYEKIKTKKENVMKALKIVLCFHCLQNCENNESCLKEQKVLLCKGSRLNSCV